MRLTLRQMCVALVATALILLGIAGTERVSANVAPLTNLQTVVPVAPPVPDPVVAASYANAFHVTLAVAQERLALENRAGNIVSQLQSALGSAYAGVWFDNTTGRYLINVAAGAPQSLAAIAASVQAARTVASTLQISGDTDVVTVGTSWSELVAAQAGIDKDLADLERSDVLQTGPDVTKDVLDLFVSASASATDKSRIEADADSDGVPTLLVIRPASALAISTSACSFPSCGRPIQGGVLIYNSANACSAGYFARANFSPYHFYVITAGHCGDAGTSTWYAEDSSGVQHTLGTMDDAIWNIDGDYARIDTAGVWWGVAPFDALSSFWGINTSYPTEYTGWSVVGQYGCRTGEGAEAAAECGTILRNGLTITYGGVTVAGEFEISACNDGGDSGGPFMLNYYAVGILSARVGDCGDSGAVSYLAEVMNAVVPANLNLTVWTIWS